MGCFRSISPTSSSRKKKKKKAQESSLQCEHKMVGYYSSVWNPCFLDDTRGGVTLVKCAQWPCTHAGERESPDQRDTRRVCWKSGIFVRCDTAVTIAAGPLQPGATDGAGPQLILRYVLLSNVTQHRRTPSALLWGCFNRLRAPQMSPRLHGMDLGNDDVFIWFSVVLFVVVFLASPPPLSWI